MDLQLTPKTMNKLFWGIVLLATLPLQAQAQSMMNTEKIFPQGQPLEIPYFSGRVWLEMLSDRDEQFNCPIGNVTFEPGCRNHWHRHPGGQILLCTSGTGRYQERNGAIRHLRPGDVVRIAPGVEHWHGAAPDDWFSHLSIETNTQKGAVEWLEPVTDAQYQSK